MKNLDFIHKILPEDNISSDQELTNFNTMHLPCVAKHFFTVNNDKMLIKTVSLLDAVKENYIILGNGSNVIFKSKFIDKAIIHLSGKDIRFFPKTDGYLVSVFAGVSLSKVVHKCIKMGASGLEWAVGIPGTIGGAVLMNAGANGSSMSNVVHKVIYYKDLSVHTALNKDCGFEYRKSNFGDCVIIRVVLFLPYGNVSTIKQKTEEFLALRRSKSAKGYSAGSVFKNQDKPAGYLIEQTGLKGFSFGDALVSNEHANVIVNNGQATGKEVCKLMKVIQKKVYKKFKVRLEPEVKIIE